MKALSQVRVFRFNKTVWRNNFCKTYNQSQERTKTCSKTVDFPFIPLTWCHHSSLDSSQINNSKVAACCVIVVGYYNEQQSWLGQQLRKDKQNDITRLTLVDSSFSLKYLLCWIYFYVFFNGKSAPSSSDDRINIYCLQVHDTKWRASANLTKNEPVKVWDNTRKKNTSQVESFIINNGLNSSMNDEVAWWCCFNGLGATTMPCFFTLRNLISRCRTILFVTVVCWLFPSTLVFKCCTVLVFIYVACSIFNLVCLDWTFS